MVLQRIKDNPKKVIEDNPFEKAPYLETEEIRGEECSQLLVKLYNNNTQQEDKQGVRIHILITHYIRSPDLLSASELCKIHPVNIKQLLSANRVNYFVKNWRKLTNDLMILNLERSYEIPFVLLSRQSRLPNLCHLTKKATDLVYQEVHRMLRKGAITVSDLE